MCLHWPTSPQVHLTSGLRRSVVRFTENEYEFNEINTGDLREVLKSMRFLAESYSFLFFVAGFMPRPTPLKLNLQRQA